MKRFAITLIALIVATFTFANNGEDGIVRGKVMDEKTGELLMFSTIVVKDIAPLVGTQTDMDGAYELKLPAGRYALEFSYVGYAKKTITEIEVKEGEVTVLDVIMNEGGLDLDEVIIKAERVDRTENAILALQKKATTIQDGISSQEMSRYGSNNAAESMKRVTGASVMEGKYIFVRGLGDRYTAAQLNGMQLPSTDPYRNSIQLDLIPSNLLENLIVSKTFTPNLPGNFTGGNVNMTAKTFPEQFTLSASVSTSYNSQSTFIDDFLSYDGGQYDWLGYDDGTRAIPSILQDPEVLSQMTSSLNVSARRDADKAALLDETSKSLNTQMAPTAIQSGISHGINFSVGNQYKMFDNPFGVLIGMNYSRSYSHYTNGIFNNFELTDSDSDVLNQDRNLVDTKSVESPQIGGLMNLAYKFLNGQKIVFNALYNHNTNKEARYLTGTFPAILSGGIFETRSLGFKERALQSYQLLGEHLLTKNGVKLEWGAAFTENTQDEPDLRFFANGYTVSDSDGSINYGITRAEYDLPFHFFRELKDQQKQAKIDLTVPFLTDKNDNNKFQFGGLYQIKERDFIESRFQYQTKSSTSEKYDGDPDSFFNEDNLGIVSYDSTRNRYNAGLFVTDETVAVNNYSGSEEIAAAYAMFTYHYRNFVFVGGVRGEQTNINVVSQDTTKEEGVVENLDFLPSANIIYRLNEKMNLRASFSQTIARPNMREMAPFSSFEYIGDFLFTGNPELERTLIKNYDVRWEWFPTAGELIALSGYYKDFTNPLSIAYVTLAANPEFNYVNLPESEVYGVEVELRKNLGFISSYLRDFKFSTNVSIIKSITPIPEDEQEIINDQNPDKGTTRPFMGQSPFLLNTALQYVNNDYGLEAFLSLNVFGDRLSTISLGGRPDVYEASRPQLDFSLRKRIGKNLRFKFSVNNILDAAYRNVLDYKGQEYINQEYKIGQSFGFGLSYDI